MNSRDFSCAVFTFFSVDETRHSSRSLWRMCKIDQVKCEHSGGEAKWSKEEANNKNRIKTSQGQHFVPIRRCLFPHKTLFSPKQTLRTATEKEVEEENSELKYILARTARQKRNENKSKSRERSYFFLIPAKRSLLPTEHTAATSEVG